MDAPQYIYLVPYWWTFGMCVRVWYSIWEKRGLEYSGLNKIEICSSRMEQLRGTW